MERFSAACPAMKFQILAAKHEAESLGGLELGDLDEICWPENPRIHLSPPPQH